MTERHSGKRLFVTAIFILVLDQVTKGLALQFLNRDTGIPILAHVFHLTLVQNQGIAFGIFDTHAHFLLGAITASVLILVIYPFFSPPEKLRDQVAYGFILGGAAGNLVDRVRLGFVVDFLDFRIWPVFNVADTFITIGVSLLILSTFKKSSHAS